MRMFARVIWIAAFLVATYSWMVAFEHGFGWQGFSQGFQTEWKNLGTVLSGKGMSDSQKGGEAAPTPPATPPATPATATPGAPPKS